MIIGIVVLGGVGGGRAGEKKNAFFYDSKDRRDPFISLVTASGDLVKVGEDRFLSDLVLEGIMVNVEGNVAVINGKIMNRGDYIGNFLIEMITNSEVILLKDQKRSTLHLIMEE